MTRCPRCQRRLPPRSGCPVHGKPSVSASAVDEIVADVQPPPGWSLGRQLAIGGSSIVYEVSAATAAPAILKWARWNDGDTRVRFEREAQLLRLLGPPSTPAYLDHAPRDAWPYVLMEEVPGETLAAWMARSGDRGTVGEVLSILMRFARALRLVHAAGIIHRDLKPENVVIGAHDARILDFGLAANERDGVSQIGAIVGTVHYLAPEQVRLGAPIDRRADIYSFGVIAFEMLAGQPPFIGERRAIEYQHEVCRPPAIRELREVHDELAQLVHACLAKQPEARPQTIDHVIEALASATSSISTVKGTSPKQLGARDKVVLAWIEGGTPAIVARAISDVHGIIVRSRPGAILAAFTTIYHEAPLAVALQTCRALASERCRIVIHLATALVRRSAQGKPAFYGPELEQIESWTPKTPFTGLVLTAVAAEVAENAATRAADVPGFWRPAARDRTDAREPTRESTLVGRERLLQEVSAVARPGAMVIALSGDEGAGKSRLLAALADKLRSGKREVIAFRARQRLLGDLPDDARLIAALGGGNDLGTALVGAGTRQAIVVIDDAHLLSAHALRQLLRDDLVASRILASRTPLFEVTPGIKRRLAIALPLLTFADAERLLRDLLQPARLIPDVLLQRLAVRGNGNPGLLVALARDIRHRGGIRKHAGTDEWYVAADEIDTLLAAPSASWFAVRALEDMPHELVPIVRVATVLGPAFTAAELAWVLGGADVTQLLAWLVSEHIVAERDGAYELVDATLADAIYTHVVEDKAALHARALRYWQAQPASIGGLARIAHHATRSGDYATAASSFALLAREARARGDLETAAAIETRR